MYRRRKIWEKIPHDIREGPRPEFKNYITDATFLEEFDKDETRKKLLAGKLKDRYTWCRKNLKNIERGKKGKKAENAEQAKKTQSAL